MCAHACRMERGWQYGHARFGTPRHGLWHPCFCSQPVPAAPHAHLGTRPGLRHSQLPPALATAGAVLKHN